jgi:hypothetical protein
MSEWTCSLCNEPFDADKLPDGAVIVSEMYRRKIVRVGQKTHILRLKHGGRKPKLTSPAMPVAIQIEPEGSGENR